MVSWDSHVRNVIGNLSRYCRNGRPWYLAPHHTILNQQMAFQQVELFSKGFLLIVEMPDCRSYFCINLRWCHKSHPTWPIKMLSICNVIYWCSISQLFCLLGKSISGLVSQHCQLPFNTLQTLKTFFGSLCPFLEFKRVSGWLGSQGKQAMCRDLVGS